MHYHATIETRVHMKACSSGTGHDQISSWVLRSHHGQFDVLNILWCKEEKELNELSRSVKYIFIDGYDESSPWTMKVSAKR